MTIIQTAPLSTGQHPIQSQSGRTSCWLDGWIEVPSNLEGQVWDSLGWCDLDIQDDVLVSITPTERPEPLVDYQGQINTLKVQLSTTDYKAIKYAEGWLTEEEYAPVKAERQKIRDEINKLEEEMKNIG